MIYDSLLDLIGGTPVIRLSKLSARLGVSVFTKLESFNPGGSHKARIALWMILDAERKGILVRGKGQTILEPSGGNTGIGLAMAGNILGYRVTLVVPDNYSPDKRQLLELYGAHVVLSDSRKGTTRMASWQSRYCWNIRSSSCSTSSAIQPTRKPIAKLQPWKS